MKPFYESEDIVLYHADCREILREVAKGTVVVTGPPYFEQPELARSIVMGLGVFGAKEAFVQWSETDRPGSTLALCAVHIFQHLAPDFRRYQTFLHFREDGAPQRWDVISLAAVGPGHEDYVGHPHQFPVALAEWLIKKSEKELTVLDPFAGSGTVLVAARNLGRKAIGIEIDRGFCEMIVNRLEK